METWLDHGQKLLIRCCLESQRQTSSTSIPFPLTSFVALFGGPGMHGYGSHEVDNEKGLLSQVNIEGDEGIQELIGACLKSNNSSWQISGLLQKKMKLKNFART